MRHGGFPGAGALVGLMLLLPGLSPEAAQTQRPRSVLLLIGDDHGRDAGCYGNPVLRTPHLDRLAAQGTRFDEAYATVSSCSPSRSVLLTGQFNHTNGQYGLAHAAHNQKTFPEVRSLPRMLGDNGYRTGIIGKYHVEPASTYPFQTEITSGLQGNRGVKEMADKARAFFDADDPRPFFLLVGYSDPHRAGEGFGNNQSYRGIERIRYDPDDVIVPTFLPDRPEVRRELAEYYESVSRLDQGIGLVLQALEQSGKRDETLVIYLSDNGIPFPGAKTNLYDSGIRLPLILRSPSQQKRGVVNRAMVSWLDVTPTILDWAGIAPPENLPGRSFLRILEEENPAGWDEVFASHVFHEITMYYPMRAIRTRTHKLIWNLAHPLPYPLASDLWRSPTWQGILRRGDAMMGQLRVRDFLQRPEYELYDLAKDPGELNNVAALPANSNVLSALQERLRRMMEETKDPWTVQFR